MKSRSEQQGLLIREQELPAATPMELLRIAMSQNADIDKLAKLMELQERWEKNEAKKAFVRALSEFKSKPPEITKNRHVKFGSTEFDHATLDHVTDQIGAALSEHGLSHTWSMRQENGAIYVTCTLTHKDGHSEDVTLSASADTSGSKNAIQAIGSTVTYLQRYTLLAATGLAARNTDDDGQQAGESAIMDDLSERLEWIANCTSKEELTKIFVAAYNLASDMGDDNARRQLVAAKNERLTEIGRNQGRQ